MGGGEPMTNEELIQTYRNDPSNTDTLRQLFVQNEGFIRKTANDSRPTPDFSIESFNYIVGADPRPMLKRKIAVSQCFIYTVLDLFSCFFT